MQLFINFLGSHFTLSEAELGIWIRMDPFSFSLLDLGGKFLGKLKKLVVKVVVILFLICNMGPLFVFKF